MVGILVHGNNHFILRGPPPDAAMAARLVRHWSVVRIGERASARFTDWELREKEFRENLQWAVVLPGEREPSPGVRALLAEMADRGVRIDHIDMACW